MRWREKDHNSLINGTWSSNHIERKPLALSMKRGFLDHQIRLGIIIVLLTAVASIISSKVGMGLLSVWPSTVLFFIFIRSYELGLACFVLSFAYQAPVVFAPSFGLSAVISLDEMMFIGLFPVWVLRNCVRQERVPAHAPLSKPLLFYILIAFLSLLARYDEISSTHFLNTGAGLTGLSPLILRLFEVVGGYFMLTDKGITPKTQQNLFRCLPIIAIFAIVLSILVSYGIFPKDVFNIEIFDPRAWYTRFSFYGNTSAWGVLLVIYFFIFLYWFFYSKSSLAKVLFVALMILCINAVLFAGAKTAMFGLMLGLILFMIKERKTIKIVVKMVSIAFIVIITGMWFVKQFATEEQKEGVKAELGNVLKAVDFSEFEMAYEETSLGSRFEHWKRFGEAVNEEPKLLVLGRGWHRRGGYETGISLHNDLLTAVHDMGIFGGVFVVWLYFSLFRQFMKNKDKTIFPDKTALLRSIMQIIAITIIFSSFASENLTFYWGVDVQFPLIIVVTGVVWKYLGTLEEKVKDAYL